MNKPLHLLNPAEMAELTARLKAEFESEGDLPMILGNRNNLFFARPARRRKPAARKKTKATA
ncbi:MAG: hypothetical protein Q8M07_04550 [Prosthecobacter sp.]|nr:hypothetical protein [Prosthecobacter sp.]HBJ86329.1 hypothetical protein [Verrucomicrobiales bacterium]